MNVSLSMACHKKGHCHVIVSAAKNPQVTFPKGNSLGFFAALTMTWMDTFLMACYEEGKMAERAFPVPVWNGMSGRWEPVDFHNGQRVVQWPAGFNAEVLPVPEYQEGDRVQFVRDECCAREGIVRLVLFQGDLSRLWHEQADAGKTSLLDADAIIYIVTARGHDHRIKASSILGRFLSLERISRVLPPQE